MRDALRKYEENLQLFPVRPADDKTAQVCLLHSTHCSVIIKQAKLEIEEAISEIEELLRELESSEMDDTEMEMECRGQKRKHKTQTRKTVQEHQTLTEYFDKPINFQHLAKKYPSFKDHVWHTRGTLLCSQCRK